MPYRYDPRPSFDARKMIHLQLTLILAWLGGVLSLPGDTFGASAAWRLFPQIATESEWAVIFFLAALIGVMGLNTTSRVVRLVSILFLATAHGTLGILFLRGSPYSGASGTFAIVAISGYYLAWRQAVSATV